MWEINLLIFCRNCTRSADTFCIIFQTVQPFDDRKPTKRTRKDKEKILVRNKFVNPLQKLSVLVLPTHFALFPPLQMLQISGHIKQQKRAQKMERGPLVHANSSHPVDNFPPSNIAAFWQHISAKWEETHETSSFIPKILTRSPKKSEKKNPFTAPSLLTIRTQGKSTVRNIILSYFVHVFEIL